MILPPGNIWRHFGCDEDGGGIEYVETRDVAAWLHCAGQCPNTGLPSVGAQKSYGGDTPTTPTQWTPPTGTSPGPSQIRTLKAEFIFLMYLSLDKFH